LKRVSEKYDTFFRRIIAGLADGIILAPIVGVFAYVMAMTDNVALWVVGLFVTYCSLYFYNMMFHWWTGQTPGKRLMDIRVVDKRERRLLTFGQSLRRDAICLALAAVGVIELSLDVIEGGWLPSYDSPVMEILDWLGIVWFLVEILTMMTNKRRRAFHDMFADSVVIKDKYW
jgi:uncharacterized RDD family membrane protein YckC